MFRIDLVSVANVTYHSKPATPFGTLYGTLKTAIWSPIQVSGLASVDIGRNVSLEKLRVA